MSRITSIEAETKEQRPLVCPADFEVGDRFYSVEKDATIKLGTVLSSTPDAVSVLWDDGTEHTFIAEFRRSIYFVLKNCGKPLDLTQLQVGSKVSRFMGGKRLTMEVTKYIPGKEVEMKFLTRIQDPLRRVASEKYSLENLMSIWELEG